MNHQDRREVAEALGRIVAALEAGEIIADTPQERRMLRRIEGAVAALAAEAGVDLFAANDPRTFQDATEVLAAPA